MINIKSFTTIKDLKESFIQGIDLFVQLGSLQRNKNVISEKLSQPFTNSSGLHHISQRDLEYAQTLKRSMLSCHNESDILGNLQYYFCSKLEGSQFTSLRSMVNWSIYHNACISDTTAINIEGIKEAIDICVSLKTSRCLQYCQSISEAIKRRLSAPKYSAPTKGLDKLSRLGEADKIKFLLYTLLKDNNKLGNDQFVNLFYHPLEQQKFNGLQTQLLQDFFSSRGPQNSKGGKDPDKEFKIDVTTYLISVSNITDGLSRYVEKYQEKTGGSDQGDILHKFSPIVKGMVSGEARNGYGQVITDSLLNSVNSYLPSSLLVSTATDISLTLLSIPFQSKGYGLINRHGVTGQIRAFLLRYILSLTSKQIGMLLQHAIQDKTEKVKKDLEKYSTSILDAYKKSIEKLPNKEQKGSLYYYLQMHASTSQWPYAPDSTKRKQWLQEKFGNLQTLP